MSNVSSVLVQVKELTSSEQQVLLQLEEFFVFGSQVTEVIRLT